MSLPEMQSVCAWFVHRLLREARGSRQRWLHGALKENSGR